MYVHPAFQTTRDRALLMLRERGFGTFVVPNPDGPPSAVHVPFLIFEEGERLRVELHVARANPLHTLIAAEGTHCLLCCMGPDAYISPEWYGAPNEVPTWTYTAVHLTGMTRLLPLAENRAHVGRMVATFEGRLANNAAPWTVEQVDPAKVAAMMQAIVSMEMIVDDVNAQLKLIQHKDAVRHRGAIAGLRRQSDGGSHAIADLMQATLDERTSS
jgi:transcriptional regulator